MMKGEFKRTDGLFSLCGLNCGLCPMQIRGGCSGCFNGSTCYQTFERFKTDKANEQFDVVDAG